MFRLAGKVSIPRAAKDVSAFLADPANEPKWQKDIVHVALVEGKAGAPGAKHERVQVVGGRNIKTVNELVETSPGKKIVFKAEGKVIEYRLEYGLAGKGDATDVEMKIEGEMLGFAAMFEGMASEALAKEIPANLERLKSTLKK